MTTSAPDREVFISAADANRGFSRVLREVREGATYVVTAHGRPVAKLTPYDSQTQAERAAAVDALIEHLKQQPVQDVGPWTREELHTRGNG